jgi:hypothetical protein
MGFKFKRINFIAGTEEFPLGNANRRARSEFILKKIVQAIIDCNCGWIIDESICDNIDDVKETPTRTSGITQPCLFLKNTSEENGAKLFVGYYGESTNNGISNSLKLFRPINSGSDIFMTGLCMSMIPAGSDSVFGDLSTPATFIPSDATPIISSRVHNNSGGWSGSNFAYEPTNGYKFSYGVFVSNRTIAISAGYSNNEWVNLGIPGFMIGEIIGTLAHSEDSHISSKYGIVNFREADRGDLGNIYECSTALIRYSTKLGSNTDQYFVGANPYASSRYFGSAVVCGAITRANETWIDGTDGTDASSSTGNYCVKMYASDPSQLSSYVFDSSENQKSRWSPIAIKVESIDLNTNGVVPGDGFKGYLDTNLIRCSIGTYGTLYNNGEFICLDSTNHLLFGWDPNNTDSIAGT